MQGYMKRIEDYELDAVPARPLGLIRFTVKPYRKQLFWFFTLTFLGMVTLTASPVVVARLVDYLTQKPELDSFVWLLVAAYIVLCELDELFWRGAEVLMYTFKPQMVERVRSMLFAVTLKRSYAYSVSSSSGQVGHWINQTRNTMNEIVDNTIWTVWGRLLGLILSAFFLFTVHWLIGLTFVTWLTLLFWFTTHRGKRFGNLVALQSNEDSRASGMVVDALSNHISVRIYNSQAREKERLLRQQHNIVGKWRRSWTQNLVTNVVKGQSAVVVSGIALVAVLLLFASGQVSLGSVVLFITYFGQASSQLWTLAWAIDAYYRSFGTIQNALDGLNGEPARKGEIVEQADIPRSVGVHLKDVHFAYPDQPDEQVLDGIDLKIEAGQKVGVVGHSGAGKSTLIGLLLGFYEPTAGHIYIGGTDISTRDPSFVRSVSSFVPQDTSLFNRTVRENILYARPDATEDELLDALKQAKAYDFVMKLTDGLDTLIGERGVKLSGGQRQRIAIARAILKDAPLLLLDEATSALDSVSEHAIQRALSGLMQHRTALVIAHRLSTLVHLDKIVVIENGSIIEQGIHDELLAANGVYADLWRRQKDGFIAE